MVPPANPYTESFERYERLTNRGVQDESTDSEEDDEVQAQQDTIPAPTMPDWATKPPAKQTREEYREWEQKVKEIKTEIQRLEEERRSRELEEDQKRQERLQAQRRQIQQEESRSVFPNDYDPTEIFRRKQPDSSDSEPDDMDTEFPFENNPPGGEHKPSPGEEEWKNQTEYLEDDSEMTNRTWTHQEVTQMMEEERDKMQRQMEETVTRLMEDSKQKPVSRTTSQESTRSNDSTVTVKVNSKQKPAPLDWPIFVTGEPGKDILEQTTRDLFNETTHVQQTLHVTRIPTDHTEAMRMTQEAHNRKPPPKPSKRQVQKRGHQSDYLLNDLGKLNLTKPDHHGKKIVLLDVPVPSDPMFSALNRDQLNIALMKQAQEELTKPEYRLRIQGADELHVTLKEVPKELWKTDQTEYYKSEAERLANIQEPIPQALVKLIPPFQVSTKRKGLNPTGQHVFQYDERPTPKSMIPPIVISKTRERANSCSYQAWADIMPPRNETQTKTATKVLVSPAKLVNLGATPKIAPGHQMSKEATEQLLKMLAQPKPPPIPARQPSVTRPQEETRPQVETLKTPTYQAPTRPQSPPLPKRTPSLGQRVKGMVTKTSTHVNENGRNDAQFSQTLRDASVIPKP